MSADLATTLLPIAPGAFWPWLIASCICIATPGPDMLTVLSVGMSRGRRAAMWMGAGVGAGCLTHTTWAAFGVAALVAASEPLFAAVKLLGALYLAVLGVQALRASLRPAPAAHGSQSDVTEAAAMSRKPIVAATGEVGALGWFVRGFINNALNPKVMLFFIAFIPQFVDARAGAVSAQMLVFGAGFALITATAYTTLGWATGQVGDALLRSPSVSRWLDRITGTLFIALAVRLAFTDRR